MKKLALALLPFAAVTACAQQPSAEPAPTVTETVTETVTAAPSPEGQIDLPADDPRSVVQGDSTGILDPGWEVPIDVQDADPAVLREHDVKAGIYSRSYSDSEAPDAWCKVDETSVCVSDEALTEVFVTTLG